MRQEQVSKLLPAAQPYVSLPTPKTIAEALIQGFRSLLRTPAYLAYATLCLGASIGLTVTAFAWIDAATHPVAPYRDPAALLRVSLEHGDRKNLPPVEDVLAQLAQVKGILGATVSTTLGAGDALEIDRRLVPGEARLVLANYFDVVGDSLVAGRVPTAADGDAAVVDDVTWSAHFAGRTGLGQAEVSVLGRPYRVIGVVRGVPGDPTWNGAWIPVASPAELQRAPGSVSTYVRLRNSNNRKDVAERLRLVAARFTAAFSRPSAPFVFSLRPTYYDRLGWDSFHYALFLAALAVLIMACSNIAGLLLVRGVARRRDYAIRLALGATHGALIRELTTEVFIVAVLGGIAGSVGFVWASGAATKILPIELTWAGFVVPQANARVIAIVASSIALALFLAAAVPAWRLARLDAFDALRETHGRVGRGTTFPIRVVVVGELSACLAVLIGAFLTLRSGIAVAAYDFGYDSRSLAAVEVIAPRRDASPSLTSTAPVDPERMVESLRALPEVARAALWASTVVAGGIITSDASGGDREPLHVPSGAYLVDQAFFPALGIRPIVGRVFEAGDATNGAAIVDSTAARTLFPHVSPIGRAIKLGGIETSAPWVTVVGVVPSIQFRLPPDPAILESPKVFLLQPALISTGHQTVRIVVRSSVQVAQMETAVRAALRAASPAGSQIRIDEWSGQRRAVVGSSLLVLLFGVLALIGLGLGTSGLFAAIGYELSLRRGEYALRAALGAQHFELVRAASRMPLTLILAATSIGAPVGIWVSSILRWGLFGIYAVDPAALVAAEATLFACCTAACIHPILLAVRSSPASALRLS